MHRIAATPGGWSPDTEGVILIEQTPAPIIFLSAADTDIQTLGAAVSHLPVGFPAIRAVNILQLQQQLSIDHYGEQVLSQAKVIILRLLGGQSYWSYGLEVVEDWVERERIDLWLIPGDDRPDPELMSHSTISLAAVNKLWSYLLAGGVDNFVQGLQFVGDVSLGTNYNPCPPQRVENVGVYAPISANNHLPKVGILFYRSHYLAGNLAPIDGLIQTLSKLELCPVAVFVSSLRDESLHGELLAYLSGIQLLLNTTSFSLAKMGEEGQLGLWKCLNVPVMQVILSGGTEAQWEQSDQGLTPRDVAMNVALPEVDGRVITRAISFKSVASWNADLETDVVVYQPRCDRLQFVANCAKRWVDLKQTPPQDRKIALILANYPNKDGRIANGVGLDTPASCVGILRALQDAGYDLGCNLSESNLSESNLLPTSGDDLIHKLVSYSTNDIESQGLRPVQQTLSQEIYRAYFATLPPSIQAAIIERWGTIPDSDFSLPGIQWGKIFVGIQPSRGYDLDPSLNYHAPDLEPTHHYLAYYFWLREVFKSQAIVHVGKHGNLEWLPGKSLALAETCYPEIALGTIPNLYPFIVNDPGEGSQAKRRGQAIILDHLTPPLTRAELYGALQQLEALIDEYYEAQTLDPSRLNLIGDRITQLVQQENLAQDLGVGDFSPSHLAQFLTLADGYLCELKEAQIRDGLHIFGQCPQGEQLRDLIISIARHSSFGRTGLIPALAQDLGYDFDPFAVEPTVIIHHAKGSTKAGKIVEELEQKAIFLVEEMMNNPQLKFSDWVGQKTQEELNWIRGFLYPSLKETEQEIQNLLAGLNGEYIPSGASGAPTRGRPEVLPTGRNFYSVDIRSIPTETAWDIGRKAAELVVERYTQENGEYPQSLALSVWGTSTMRTGGDDIAQVLALLGVRPVWDGLSRRVVDFEILPLSVLNRPRVDVTLRISGFFRDAFPNLIDLVYHAIAAVANLSESPSDNPLAHQVQQETHFWQEKGLELEKAQTRALHRIFGSKPGAYGAGLQGLIESQNWSSDEDLARAYLNWSSYAYSPQKLGDSAPEAFEKRLANLQIVLHNQDNREHDLLDSDDYYQFQGGLTAAVRAITGQNPTTYFGDNSLPSHPKIRHLKEEIARVYRSRVVNPKWIAGVMRHGYKGAFEMAATVDYLFAYDATAQCVEDFMYEGVANAYLLEEKVQAFIQSKNPWALRDMAERLLEANQRGLWQSAPGEILEQLKLLANQAEGAIESNLGSRFE
ncbi:cobaltochelatase subunit CobN [Spirulina subsalsa FACHB-351]|uniref:Cobaltochelatase subunit CobN n=1 Tax=Spirulina subsalsa FACHB-351 TaxID=234711 RepID=A0ABT3L5F7_9CYAN|nr:cobaltochelatase subunit CobN [Spirulina subsalsa]MCW6036724.1 cobaltochelatase subunit CobN [Spirulina subsalsa FACHB-351]